MSQALVIFKAISSEQEKQTLLQKLLGAQGTVTLKDKSENCVTLKVSSLNSQSYLKCPAPANLSFTTPFNSLFVVNFDIGNERYLFESRPTLIENHIVLPVTHLYHLQRRENFRYSIPPSYSATFVLHSLNHKACNLQGHLIDISTEGCAIEISQEDAAMSQNDIVTLEILIGNRTPIPTQGLIKNLRVRGVSHLILGIEFDHLAIPCEESIIAALTDLQRELYFRKAG